MANALSREIQDLARNSIDALVPLIMSRVFERRPWVPTIVVSSGSVSYLSRSGWSVRIGSLVGFYGRIQLADISSPSGPVQIYGLPYAAAAQCGAAVTRMSSITLDTGFTWIGGVIPALEQYIDLEQYGSGLQATPLDGAGLIDADLNVAGVEVMGVYEAAEGVAPATPGTASAIAVSATPPVTIANGVSVATVTAIVVDDVGVPVPGITVAWSVASGVFGSVAAVTTVTDDEGQVTAVFTASTTSGVANVRALVTSPSLFLSSVNIPVLTP